MYASAFSRREEFQLSAFLSGIELSRLFYQEAVRPVLDAEFPGLRHSAALLGRGSEVLGFDDEMSSDHNWEPRVLLFVQPEEHRLNGAAISEKLRRSLPAKFRGHPTDYRVQTLRDYLLEHLDLDIDHEITPCDWLTFSEQRLRMITAGAVYHDEVGLQDIRDRFSYYPHDVWLYLLVTGWWRIHPEANIVGRAGFAGDELGSALIGSRLVVDLMRLCFLMEKQYAPYSKWFGTAFSRLECAGELSPILWSVLRAQTWPERENALLAAYEALAAMHNTLGITPPVTIAPYQIWNRPFTVMWGDFIGALGAEIRDPAVKHIAERWLAGPVDQFRDTLWPTRSRRALLRVFD
jgi:hypothetical protein